MPIKITCPHCSIVHRFTQPFPLPGSEVQCGCGRVLVISFPANMMARMESSGASFSDPLAPTDDDATPYQPAPTPALPRRRGPAAATPPDSTGHQGDPT